MRGARSRETQKNTSILPSKNTSEKSNRNMVNEQIFSIGSRTYFVTYEVNNVGQGYIDIRYGAAIKRYNGPRTRLREGDKEGHMKTARERFSRFPASGKIKVANWVRTRGDLERHMESSRFKKRLVNLFAKNGVRERHGRNDSLMKKELWLRRCILNKKLNQAKAGFDEDMREFRKAHKNDKFSRETGGQVNVERFVGSDDLPTHRLRLNMDGRIFHIMYQRNECGLVVYGACVFNPKTEDDWESYDEEEHFETAQTRFKNYPVEVKVGRKHSYETRLSTSGEFNSEEEFKDIRNKIAKYGVRVRPNGTRFIREHELKTEFGQETKRLNRQLMSVMIQEHNRKVIV